MTKMYWVGYLYYDTVKEIIQVKAINPKEAYKKAEERYKENGWEFEYTDMYLDTPPLF